MKVTHRGAANESAITRWLVEVKIYGYNPIKLLAIKRVIIARNVRVILEEFLLMSKLSSVWSLCKREEDSLLPRLLETQ